MPTAAPLRAWSLAILGALEPKLTREQEALGNRSVSEFTAYLETLVADRRKHPGDPEHDVLTRLIQGEAAGEQLSETELLQNCVFILNAGHETTTNLIGNALVALQEWPAEKEALLRAHATPGAGSGRAGSRPELRRRRIPALRVVQPAGQPPRRCAHARWAACLLEEGALVTLCIGAANRDPAQFADPDVLDLSRANNRHLAFGFGIHQCAGLSLARLEGRIAIGRFLARFPGYRLTGSPVRGGRARFRGFLHARVRDLTDRSASLDRSRALDHILEIHRRELPALPQLVGRIRIRQQQMANQGLQRGGLRVGQQDVARVLLVLDLVDAADPVERHQRFQHRFELKRVDFQRLGQLRRTQAAPRRGARAIQFAQHLQRQLELPAVRRWRAGACRPAGSAGRRRSPRPTAR